MLQLEAMNPHAMDIQFTTHIFKEARSFVAHALELDVSSCGSTKEKALKNFKEAVRLFLEGAEGAFLGHGANYSSSMTANSGNSRSGNGVLHMLRALNSPTSK